MLTLFYSPHMTSVDNEAGRASGHADVPLSPAGREQAHALGQHYAAYPLDAVYCSDLQRAWVTAEIAFAGRGLPITRDARLRECDFGAMTQHPPAELDDASHLTAPYPGGESLLVAAERVGAFLRDAIRDRDGQSIVVIGHRATKYGIQLWCGDQPLAPIVRAPWEWRDIPIWRFTLSPSDLDRPARID